MWLAKLWCRLRTPQAVDNYFYTLTGSQDLENFLVDKNIDSLQFVNCSQSLMYLSAEVFATTLNQLLNRLAPSGEIFVWGVGKMTGPLPAFTWVRAEALRGEKRSQDVRDLNLFAPDNNVAVEVPLLTVRPDWPELKHRLDQLLLRLHDFNTVTPKDEAILVAAYFSQYQRFKLEARNNWSALATVADAAAMEALHYRVRLHGVIEEMKNRQYQKQVPAKQAYLKELQQRSDLSFKTLRTTEDGLIDTFVITNQARRESAASYLKSALPVPEKP